MRQQIIHCRTKAHYSGNILRSRFKLLRVALVGRLGECDILNHVPAALIRRQLFQPLRFAVQRANPRRTKNLVAGEGEEVDVERLNVDGNVRGGLRAVHEDRNAGGVGERHDLFNRIDRAERIGDVGDGDNLCAGAEQRRKLVKQQLPAIIDRRDPDHSARLFGE